MPDLVHAMAEEETIRPGKVNEFKDALSLFYRGKSPATTWRGRIARNPLFHIKPLTAASSLQCLNWRVIYEAKPAAGGLGSTGVLSGASERELEDPAQSTAIRRGNVKNQTAAGAAV